MMGRNSSIRGGSGSSTKPGWDGAISEAMWFHQRYVDELSTWSRFQKKHGDKLQMWDTIRKLLAKSANTGGISTQQLYDALGVSTYHEDKGTGWDISKGLYAALEFDEDASLAALDKKAGSVNANHSCDNEFICFGREVVTKRASVEIAAAKLVDYMKFGREKEDYSFAKTDTGLAEKTHPTLDQNNEFYSDFVEYPLAEQIVIAKQLTFGLAHSKRGKDFLASLFEYQHRSIFSPFAFTELRSVSYDEDTYYQGEQAIEQGKERYLTIFAKDREAYEQRYLTEDGRYKLEETPDIQTDSLPEHLAQLLAQLYPGLMHFRATRTADTNYMNGVTAGSASGNTRDNDSRPDPDAVVSKFTEGIVGLFLNDDHIRQIIDGVDWSKTPHDKPDWSKDYLKGGSDGAEWTKKETRYIGLISVNAADGLSIPGGVFVLPVKLLLTAMGAYTAYTSMSESDTDVEYFKKVRKMGKTLTSVSSYEESLSKGTTGQKALKVLGTVGTCLDIVLTVVYVQDIAEEMNGGDYDAAGGYALMGLSGLASIGAWGAGLGAGGSIFTAAGATLGLISGGLVVVAFALAALGAAVLYACDESTITEWVRYTYFGKGWSGLTQTNVLNPRSQTFRYKQLSDDGTALEDEADFPRQMSTLYSLVRPIGLSEAVAGTRSRSNSGPEYPYGTFTIEPFQQGVWQNKDDVEILETGLLFVGPVEIIDSDSGLKRTVTTDGNYLHRISLGDDPGGSASSASLGNRESDEWQTKLKEYKPNSYGRHVVGFVGTNTSMTNIDLVIEEKTGTTNNQGEATVSKWEGTLWAMAGDGSNVFGWRPGEIQGAVGAGEEATFRDHQYLEVIYVPPNIADWMQRSEAVIRPQDLPTVTRERVPISHEDYKELIRKTTSPYSVKP